MKIKTEDIKKIQDSLNFMKSNPDLKINDYTVEDFEDLFSKLIEYTKKLEELEFEMFSVKRKTEKTFKEVKSISFRVRKLVVGYYGEDSKEVKELGLKAKSEYKNAPK
ncbi:hypothetical protein JXR93_08730 [bacterium]|nr:hypothetical protein [bacterium]